MKDILLIVGALVVLPFLVLLAVGWASAGGECFREAFDSTRSPGLRIGMAFHGALLFFGIAVIVSAPIYTHGFRGVVAFIIAIGLWALLLRSGKGDDQKPSQSKNV